MNDTEKVKNSRRGFLRLLLGLPLGFTAVKVIYGHQETRKKLLLNIFSIAGYQYYDGETLEKQLKPNDRLCLRPEPGNPHDEFAVEIRTENGQKLGYVPRSANKAISRLLQQGANLEARITRIQPENESWQRVKVKINLIV